MRKTLPISRRAPSSSAPHSRLSLASLLLVAACSVYRAEDLPPTTNGGSSPVPQGGEPAASGSTSGGTVNGGTTAAGTTNGGTSPSVAGSGGTTASEEGGSAAMGGAAGEAAGAGGEGGEGGESGPDECPNDPDKRSPGVCGCGIPDVSTPTLSSCQSLKAALVHRYDFEGTGAVVTDRVGSAHGTVSGATLSKVAGRGVVSLTGGSSGPHVDLPNKLVSSLTSVTVEAWITWRGGAPWQRVFDFGDSTATPPENNPASGNTYLFATPRSENDVALASYSHEGNADGQQLEATASAPLTQSLSQVVVVANGTAHKLIFYVNGTKLSEQGWTGSLSKINDVNVWIGRSQYVHDPKLNAVVHDFRIYQAALSETQVATAHLGGPDAAFLLEPPAATPSSTP